jgi:cell fate (sporulation/competence/biofilm development) regulator YmcA (YheA/YmcA/DUF963 family)
MKANEIYQTNADKIYAQIGHAVMQKKQIQEKIDELEFQLKALVLSHPYLQEIERKILESSDGEE